MENENNGTTFREPLLTYGAVAAVVSALLSLLLAFGVNITPEQTDAVLRFVAAVMPFVVAFVMARRRVTPVDPPRDENTRA